MKRLFTRACVPTRAVSLPRSTGAPLSAAGSELGHVVGSTTAQARLHPDFAIDYVTNLCYTRFVSSLMRGVSGDDPAGGARRGVPRLAARNRSAGGPGPRPPGLTARQRANRWSAPVPLPETAARVPGRKSPRWSAERASRLQRDGPCLASAADRASQARWKRRVRLSALHRPLAGVGANMKDATRTPKGAAGTKGAVRNDESKATSEGRHGGWRRTTGRRSPRQQLGEGCAGSAGARRNGMRGAASAADRIMPAV